MSEDAMKQLSVDFGDDNDKTSLINVIRADVEKAMRKRGIKASLFVHIGSIYFPINKDKAEVTIHVHMTRSASGPG